MRTVTTSITASCEHREPRAFNTIPTVGGSAWYGFESLARLSRSQACYWTKTAIFTAQLNTAETRQDARIPYRLHFPRVALNLSAHLDGCRLTIKSQF
jgi:hypothetical protein